MEREVRVFFSSLPVTFSALTSVFFIFLSRLAVGLISSERERVRRCLGFGIIPSSQIPFLIANPCYEKKLCKPFVLKKVDFFLTRNLTL